MTEPKIIPTSAALTNWAVGSESCVVSRLEDLDVIQSWAWALAPRKSVRISIAGIRDVASSEREINNLLADCGCKYGAMALFICMAACCILVYLDKLDSLRVWSPTFGQAICICVGVSAVGKAAGIFRKKGALRSAVLKIQTDVDSAYQRNLSPTAELPVGRSTDVSSSV